jgi:hypothetical protein
MVQVSRLRVQRLHLTEAGKFRLEDVGLLDGPHIQKHLRRDLQHISESPAAKHLMKTICALMFFSVRLPDILCCVPEDTLAIIVSLHFPMQMQSARCVATLKIKRKDATLATLKIKRQSA